MRFDFMWGMLSRGTHSCKKVLEALNNERSASVATVFNKAEGSGYDWESTRNAESGTGRLQASAHRTHASFSATNRGFLRVRLQRHIQLEYWPETRWSKTHGPFA
jgi:hypothetical protein